MPHLESFIFSGDFRQILPVIRMGGEAQIVDNCVFHLPFWRSVETFTLTQNMRVKDQSSGRWCEFLLKVGEGTQREDRKGRITLPQQVNLAKSLEEMIQNVFEGDFQRDIGDRGILCPTNEQCVEVNKKCLEMFPPEVESETYQSIDKVVTDAENVANS